MFLRGLLYVKAKPNELPSAATPPTAAAAAAAAAIAAAAVAVAGLELLESCMRSHITR